MVKLLPQEISEKFIQLKICWRHTVVTFNSTYTFFRKPNGILLIFFIHIYASKSICFCKKKVFQYNSFSCIFVLTKSIALNFWTVTLQNFRFFAFWAMCYVQLCSGQLLSYKFAKKFIVSNCLQIVSDQLQKVYCNSN